MTALVVEVIAPRPGVSEATSVTVKIGTDWNTPMPTDQMYLPGVEADYLNTLVSEVVSAWAYEASIRDVRKTFAQIRRLARAHGRSSEF